MAFSPTSSAPKPRRHHLSDPATQIVTSHIRSAHCSFRSASSAAMCPISAGLQCSLLPVRPSLLVLEARKPGALAADGV